MAIRNLRDSDREELERMICSIHNFNESDKSIALELIDDALQKKEKSDYVVHVLEDQNEKLLAYVCFGKTPLTESTYDFYWMVIDPSCQRRGFGLMLFQYVEDQIRLRGGKLIMCETSSLDGYERVVRLYEKLGYQPVARIRDFYRDGDDKLIYMKSLKQTSS